MGAGKSSVGRALGQRLNWIFEDLDDRIERRASRKVADIFRDAGEPEFRRAEHAALQEVLQELRGGVSRIVALGGGAFVQDDNAKLLRNAGVTTLFLDAPVEELWERCCRQASELGAERPLLRSQDQFRELHQIRRKKYSRASVRFETAGRAVDAIADEIVQRLEIEEHRNPPGRRRSRVKFDRTIFRVAAFLLVSSLALLTPSLARDKKEIKPGAAQTVDSGAFGVFMKGQRVATETFDIQQQNSESSIKSQFKQLARKRSSQPEIRPADYFQRAAHPLRVESVFRRLFDGSAQ